jgi:hypothetical protein
MAKTGTTLGVVDLLIAQVALENRLKVLTPDNHFKIIQKHSKLDLVAFNRLLLNVIPTKAGIQTSYLVSAMRPFIIFFSCFISFTDLQDQG